MSNDFGPPNFDQPNVCSGCGANFGTARERFDAMKRWRAARLTASYAEPLPPELANKPILTMHLMVDRTIQLCDDCYYQPSQKRDSLVKRIQTERKDREGSHRQACE